ncbi:MAG: alcohol dehydrogenase family protein [Rhizobiales bacterium]|nr:alcohol dehydrogenase family protein [Hyphomicrobiales bacterium]
MTAVLLTGHGGFDKLVYRDDVPVPRAGPEEVLIKVAAAGINNTDINTRIGWYSKQVTGGTGQSIGARIDPKDAAWSGASVVFPRIQGADCCGRIVSTGDAIDKARTGERVIVRNMLRSYVDHRPYECWTFGAECDGAFAQYAKAPANETYRVDCDWSDAELASLPCAYSTAENMLHRTGVKAGETVLVTGASGGVGSAAIQLSRRRGANVLAIASPQKASELLSLGANRIIARDADLTEAIGAGKIDVVIDVVGGPAWPRLIDTLKRGGRYAVAGAIAGPLVGLDLRELYLRDLTFFGCTFQDDQVFENLIRYVERGEIRPVVSRTYPLSAIVEAQQDFLAKQFTGKLVLIPPA